jgi:hypothetical protein
MNAAQINQMRPRDTGAATLGDHFLRSIIPFVVLPYCYSDIPLYMPHPRPCMYRITSSPLHLLSSAPCTSITYIIDFLLVSVCESGRHPLRPFSPNAASHVFPCIKRPQSSAPSLSAKADPTFPCYLKPLAKYVSSSASCA